MNPEIKEPNLFSEDNSRNPEEEKEQAKMDYAKKLRILGNLSEPEIAELVDLDITRGPQNLEEQIRMFYLRYKSQNPDSAERMRAAMKGLKLEETINDDDFDKLLGLLREYYPGFVIYHKGKRYKKDGVF